MAEYYRPIVYLNDKITIYEESKYRAKLMEHSYIDIPYMAFISKKFYKTKGRLCWCSDYIKDNEISFIGLTIKDVWNTDGEEIEYAEFSLNDLFLCNHDTKQYIDLNKYIKKSTREYDWEYITIHPLSILTMTGSAINITNSCMSGLWKWNLISFESEIPTEYNELEVVFKDIRY